MFTHLFPVTKFYPPRGRTEETVLGTHDPECARLVDEVLATGRARFTVEVLRTGDLSLCCEDSLDDRGDIAMEIVFFKYSATPDGWDTKILEKINDLIRAAHRHFFPEAPTSHTAPAPETENSKIDEAGPRVLVIDETGITEISFDDFLLNAARSQD